MFLCAHFFNNIMRIILRLRPPLRFCVVKIVARLGLWDPALVLYDGFGGWCIQYAWCFFRGLWFCGFVGVPEARVVSEPPSLRWPCAQCPSFTSSTPPQLCHCSQARLGQPRRWRAKQQEIQDSLVYEYSVWCNAACTGPTGAFEADIFQCCL